MLALAVLKPLVLKIKMRQTEFISVSHPDLQQFLTFFVILAPFNKGF